MEPATTAEVPVIKWTRSELTPAEAAGWIGENHLASSAELKDPDGTVIGLMGRGPGWRLVWTPGEAAVVLLRAELPLVPACACSGGPSS